MSLTGQIAAHFREVHFGGNWTSVHFKQTLADVDWKLAVQKRTGYNTIAVLVYHTHYYIREVLKVLQGEPLQASDKESFNCPEIRSREDWIALQDKVWADAEAFASLVEQLPDAQLTAPFANGNYGNYYRNLHGILEHCHYHLGQIVILKKMLL